VKNFKYLISHPHQIPYNRDPKISVILLTRALSLVIWVNMVGEEKGKSFLRRLEAVLVSDKRSKLERRIGIREGGKIGEGMKGSGGYCLRL
jgi:hypothetical protein